MEDLRGFRRYQALLNAAVATQRREIVGFAENALVPGDFPQIFDVTTTFNNIKV